MNANWPLTADPAVIRPFVERIHAAAAAAFAGASQPGMMQLVRIHPGTEDTIASRFAIGDVDFMVDEAVRQANAGFNVYVEGRTVSKTATKRGSLADTVGVFGFVVDADHDKGKGGRTTVQPSLIVETSPGNAHHWLLLDRALTVEQAQPLGAAIRHGTGADAATGVLSQPYRVPGTPNYPGKLKVARGRVATPTGIISLEGRIWSADELRAAFPAREKPQATNSGSQASGPSGRTSATAKAIIAETGDGDRSARFFDAVKAAFGDGLTPDDLEDLMRQHPQGCGAKYLDPYDRLRREIDRAWEKVEAKAEETQRAAERPAYEDASNPVEEARQAVEEAVLGFLEAASVHILLGDEEAEPPVHALAVSTGVGKTSATAKAVAQYVNMRRGAGRSRKAILYAVPTHRLGVEIERLFAEHGLTARVFRGRQASDPDRPGQTMCDDLEAVEIALGLGEAVTTSCCRVKPKGKPEQVCEHFHACSYQAQQASRPDVWIVAHQMLFRAQTALGKVEMVVIDEGFWQSGLRIPKRGLTLDEIRAHLPLGKERDDSLHNDIEQSRGQLADALRGQSDTTGIGGVRRDALIRAGISGQTCTDAIDREWRLKGKATIFPGMPRPERRVAARAATHARHVRSYVSVWAAARGLLYDEAIETSGRLYLEHRDDDGEGQVIVVKARSLKAIATGWHVPTLMLDATLPSPDILRAFFPQVEVPTPIEAAMPHVRARQVLSAPVAAHKLRIADGESAGRNLRSIRREILRRFIELGRAPLLVIAQKATADWLRGSTLPDGVSVEHFNAVAGLDRYRDVRGLMVIGRTVPSPAAVEALAGAIVGQEPTLIPKGSWYGKAVRGIRTRSGSSAGVECDAHPDPVAEACRYQICEGELMQAIGRARGVNRTADTPLDIDILANVVLPMTVDEVTNWSPPGEEIDMLIDGIVLDSAGDMAAAWPETWPSDGAARNWIYRHTGAASHTVTDAYKKQDYIGIRDGVRFRYQRAGARQKWRTGAYDPAVIPDLRGWLETRLGTLAGFDIPGTAEAAPAASARTRAPRPTARQPLPRPAPGRISSPLMRFGVRPSPSHLAAPPTSPAFGSYVAARRTVRSADPRIPA